MSDFINQAFFWTNLPFTILVIGLGIYWLVAALGVIDVEGDADLHHADADVHAHHGPLGGFLHFVNFGEVPVMIVVSIFALSMWVLGMVGNFLFNDGSIVIGLALLIPAFGIAAVLTRVITTPFRKIFKLLNQPGPEALPMVGRTCVIRTSEANAEFGQAEVQTEGSPLLIQVRTREGQSLPQGESALIIADDPTTRSFTVIQVSNDTLEA